MKRLLPKQLALWHIVVPLLALANLAFFSQNILSSFVTLGFFLFAPGYLLLRRLHLTASFNWAIFSLAVGLSLSLLTITGLLLNSFHALGFGQPLQTLLIFIALDAVCLGLLAINTQQKIKLHLPKLSFTKEELMFGFVLTLLPLLAAGGAMRLNNGASNILTMVLMATVAVLFIVLPLRPGLRRIFPYAIFMTGLSFLLANSLRGWFITGHDIHHEFSVFQIVMSREYWQATTSHGDPYNACLSITILPAILAKITHISDPYIFRFVYQVVFAAMLPALFVLFRKFTNDRRALLGVFAFMTFPTFINDLPFLNRQEIAFGYFILLMLVNFMDMTRKVKTFLTVLLLLSMVLSHYSTSYATLGILLMALLFYKILHFFTKNPKEYTIPLLRLPIITLALLATFVWNAQITVSSSNFTNTLASTIKGLVGGNSQQSNFFRYNLLAKATLPDTPENQFEDFATKKGNTAKYAKPAELPITQFGNTISKVIDVKSLNQLLHSSVAKVLQLFVLIGTVILFIRYRRGIEPKRIYFLALVFSCIGALVVFTFLPQLSIGYDITRLFQQSMTVLWLPIILAAEWLFGFLGRLKTAAVAGMLVFLYLTMSGFIPQITGGYLPQLALNNSGYYYNFFYTQKSDLVATDWLAVNRIRYKNIFMDTNAATPPLQYPVAVGLLNNRMTGYIYLDHANNATGVYRMFMSSGFIQYTNPGVIDPSNLIYSNQQSKIYLK